MKWSHSSWFRITNHLREWLMEIPPIDISKHGENGDGFLFQWEFQDPKMELLISTVPYFRPYALGVYPLKFRSVPEMARDHSGRILGG